MERNYWGVTKWTVPRGPCFIPYQGGHQDGRGNCDEVCDGSNQLLHCRKPVWLVINFNWIKYGCNLSFLNNYVFIYHERKMRRRRPNMWKRIMGYEIYNEMLWWPGLPWRNIRYQNMQDHSCNIWRLQLKFCNYQNDPKYLAYTFQVEKINVL